MLQYILEVTLCWALFYLIFFGLLRKLTFFSVNRWYLLGSLILGMLIPQLRHIELNMYQEEISESLPIAIMVKEIPAQVAVTVEEVSATMEWSTILANVLWGVYIVGLVFFGFRLFRSLYRIYRLHMDGRKEVIDGASIIYTQSEHLPFSFWDTIYISDRVELTEEFQDILEHERTHVKSLHSIDVLLIELIQIAFWFNPMIYVYKTALRQTHEYLADAAVLQQTSRKTYGTMLLKQSLSGLEIALTHQFFHSHIKKRINMMYQKKSGRSAWLKYALALPVLFVLTVVFANKSDNGLYTANSVETAFNKEENKIFIEANLKAQLSDIEHLESGDKKAMTKVFEALAKDYLLKYPDDHKDILLAIFSWGFENGYRINWHIAKGDVTMKDSDKLMIKEIDEFSLSLKTLNRNSLYVGDHTEDYSIMTKETVQEYLDMLITGKANHTDALEDFIHFSYAQRYNKAKIDELVRIYQEVLEEAKLDVYDDFQNVQINTEGSLPTELMALKDVDLDDPSMPIIWTREWITSQPITEFVDLDEPIKAIYYLPPAEAIKVFGDKGSKGFYALMGYEWPLTHPQKQRELLDFEMDNFFSTLANDINEKAWAEKLKEVHKKMQQRYPKVGDWVTPFTTKAHKYNINLVIKNKEIIAAYRNENDVVERIDNEPKKEDDVFEIKKLLNTLKQDSTYPISEHNSVIYIGSPKIKCYIKVSANGERLEEGIDYSINEDEGTLSVLNKDLINRGIPVKVEFDDSHLTKLPLFPGCRDVECSQKSLLEYLYKNIRYPATMRSDLIQGITYIGLRIDEHGDVAKDFTIHESLGDDADAELKSIVDGLRKKGSWVSRIIEHEQGKLHVGTSMLLPVTFRLQDEQRNLIDYKKSTFDVPDRYDVIFDEIVVTGFANSTKN